VVEFAVQPTVCEVDLQKANAWQIWLVWMEDARREFDMNRRVDRRGYS
jgi:hypothetical protein